MPKSRKYYPDYSKLYPGVDIPANVLSALRQSDRKMKYMEYGSENRTARQGRKRIHNRSSAGTGGFP